jgi:hypothetical protein
MALIVSTHPGSRWLKQDSGANSAAIFSFVLRREDQNGIWFEIIPGT